MKIVLRFTLMAFVLTLMTSVTAQDVRTIDGSSNNASNPEWGAEGSELFRLTAPKFADGVSEMNGSDRPNPRMISN